MSAVLPLLLVVAMLATLGVLLAGIISFAFRKKGSSKNATRLMAARVALQGLAVGLLGLIVLAYAN